MIAKGGYRRDIWFDVIGRLKNFKLFTGALNGFFQSRFAFDGLRITSQMWFISRPLLCRLNLKGGVLTLGFAGECVTNRAAPRGQWSSKMNFKTGKRVHRLALRLRAFDLGCELGESGRQISRISTAVAVNCTGRLDGRLWLAHRGKELIVGASTQLSQYGVGAEVTRSDAGKIACRICLNKL
jgi:hypothetical protein